jgi:MYXO-CTERM domain-containing protein
LCGSRSSSGGGRWWWAVVGAAALGFVIAAMTDDVRFVEMETTKGARQLVRQPLETIRGTNGMNILSESRSATSTMAARTQ